jgi:hypothetical protein
MKKTASLSDYEEITFLLIIHKTYVRELTTHTAHPSLNFEILPSTKTENDDDDNVARRRERD